MLNNIQGFKKFNNSVFKLNNLGFDPIFDRMSIAILEYKITYYSRRYTRAFGYAYKNVIVSISKNTPAFEKKDEQEIFEYMNKHWFDFLVYGLNGSNPNYIAISISPLNFIEPQWDTQEEVENYMGISGYDLQPISPY